MRKLLVLAVALMASSAMAAGMDGFVGNTLVIKDAKGKELARTVFAQDGTYSTKRGTTSVNGKWRVNGAAICTTESGSDEEECVDLNLSGKAAGDSWKVTGNGMNLALKLEAGA